MVQLPLHSTEARSIINSMDMINTLLGEKDIVEDPLFLVVQLSLHSTEARSSNLSLTMINTLVGVMM